MQRDTGTSPEAGILKGGTVSLCISQEALAQEQLSSWGHPLQISKALTQIFWPMAPFCYPWCMVTHIAPFWKIGSRQRWLHKQSLREVTWAESTCKLIRLCGSMTSVMRSPCFLGRKTSIVGEPVPALLLYLLCSLKSLKHWRLKSTFSSFHLKKITIFCPHWDEREEGQARGMGHKMAGDTALPRVQARSTSAALQHVPGFWWDEKQTNKTHKPKNNNKSTTHKHISNSSRDSCTIFDKIPLGSLPLVLFNKRMQRIAVQLKIDQALVSAVGAQTEVSQNQKL